MIFIIYYLIFSASNCARAVSSLFANKKYNLYQVLYYSAVTFAITNQIKLCTLLLMIADAPLHYAFILLFSISLLTLSQYRQRPTQQFAGSNKIVENILFKSKFRFKQSSKPSKPAIKPNKLNAQKIAPFQRRKRCKLANNIIKNH